MCCGEVRLEQLQKGMIKSMRFIRVCSHPSFRYWEERNKERFAQIAAMPRKPEYAAIHAKIDAARAARRERDNSTG